MEGSGVIAAVGADDFVGDVDFVGRDGDCVVVGGKVLGEPVGTVHCGFGKLKVGVRVAPTVVGESVFEMLPSINASPKSG